MAQTLADDNVKAAQAATLRAAEADARADALTEDVAQARTEAQRAREEADSHKQLIRSLQLQLGEQEKKTGVEVDARISELEAAQKELQRQLAEARQQLPLNPSKSSECIAVQRVRRILATLRLPTAGERSCTAYARKEKLPRVAGWPRSSHGERAGDAASVHIS